MSTSAQAKSFFTAGGLSAARDSMTPASGLPPPKQSLTSPPSPSCLPSNADIIHAITTGAGLRLAYQPQYDLHTLRMTGAEAQLRWRHSVHGDVPLSVLAPMVDRLGLHVLLFNFIVTHAIDVLCRRRFDANMSLTVHASARTVCAPGIATLLANRMSRAGLPPWRLKIDMSEDLAEFNEARLLACLDALRAKGFLLSLDVVGASPACLNLLSTMPFDEVKIDAALIHAGERTSAAKVLAIVTEFKLKLLVQGIDNDDMIAPLRHIGCGTGQGNALSCSVERGDLLKNSMINASL